ncbi:uncharacterized protein LOC114532167 [Dendronephthya gigantea]|uniref:uncharacterized protein LOC114532167 n=1 Tax=Dendronephthya gigantea TaxID=151771 RepID=UPI00106B40F7|nr:uncharacterized protein LOC114532167 [Dendronephthya gigantea]
MIDIVLRIAVIFSLRFLSFAAVERSLISQVPSYRARFTGARNNYGTHFIIGFTAQYTNNRNDYIRVYIAALDETNVTMYSEQTGQRWSYTVGIKNGGIFELKLPISLRLKKDELRQKSIEILSTGNISVLCLNFGGFSSQVGSNMALPSITFGLVYVVASFQPYNAFCRANIAVLSAHNNNKIIILPNKNAIIYYRGNSYEGKTSQIHLTEVLEKNEALYFSAKSDLTGTLVFASKPVTVISSVDRTEKTLGSAYTAFFEATLLPVSLWGFEYILAAVGTLNKLQGDIFRISSFESNTEVKSAYWTRVLSSGAYVELILDRDLASYIKCNKPCQVVQYIRGGVINGKHAGPSMLILPSVTQFLSYYHVALPRRAGFNDSLTIIIEKENMDGLYRDGLKLDGLRWKSISGTKYVWTIIDVFNVSTVTVYHTSSLVKFGLLVYGWNNGASYAYPGGFDFNNSSNDGKSSKALLQIPSYKSRMIGTQGNYGRHFIVGFTSQYATGQKNYIEVSILAQNETNVRIYSNQTDRLLSLTENIRNAGIFRMKLPNSIRWKRGWLQKGIEILSSADISVLCLNVGGSSYKTDGNLALPTNTQGLVHVIASYWPHFKNLRANIAVISAHNNNKVIILPNRNAIINYRGNWYDSKSSQIQITQVLQKLDTLYVSGISDLSGTLVIASKPVTVISGVEQAKIGKWYNFMEGTLLPVSLWGYEYILTTVATMEKSQGDVFRVFAYENDTVVQSAYWTKVLSSGTYENVSLNKDLASYVKCNKPCQVVQYIRGGTINGKYAIPSMLVLPSVSQFLSYYHVPVPKGEEYHHDSITIVIEKGNVDGLYWDGLKFKSLRWKTVTGTNYVWTVIDILDPNIITVYHASSSVKFGLLIYGWKDRASYSYPGGFSLHNKSNDISSMLSAVPSYKSRIVGTNYGKHFIIGFTPQSSNRQNDYIGVSILAFDETNVKMNSEQTGQAWSYTVNIKNGTVFELQLPTALRMQKDKGFLQKGIEILSTGNISVVSFNFAGNIFQVDGNLALPSSSLGPGLVYIVASYQPYSSNFRASIAIISAENNNRITVLPNKNAKIYYRGIWYSVKTSQTQIFQVLAKRDALYVWGKSDLSGTVVTADKPVTVISAVDRTDKTLGFNSFLEANLLPVSLWGYRYIFTAVRTMERTQGDIFRIFVFYNNTVVKSAYWTKVLSSGMYENLTLGRDLASYVKCNKPCQVVQYIRGESKYLTFRGSSMIILPSVSQFLSFYYVALARGAEYSHSITIVIEKENVDGLYRDGLKLNGLQWKTITGTRYVWSVISLPDPSNVKVYHTSSVVKFGLFVFGWNDKASFGYPGGFGLHVDKPQGPSKPRNVTVTVSECKLIVKWLVPADFQGDISHYFISWGKNGESDTFQTVKTSESPFIINDFCNESGTYTIKVQAVNDMNVVGEIAYVYNVSIDGSHNVVSSVSSIFITPSSITERQSSYVTANTYKVTKPSNPTVIVTSNKDIPTGVIAGGVIGAVVFLCLAVFTCVFLIRIIRKYRRMESREKFAEWHPSSLDKMANTSVAGNKPLLQETNPILQETNEALPLEISYVSILKDWQISPSCLKILSKSLGSGHFGIVRQGLYTPSAGSAPEYVAVKMMKDIATESNKLDFLAELKMLKESNKEPHENVLKFIGGCLKEGKQMLVTEYCSAGNMHEFLRKSRVADKSDISQMQNLKIHSTLSERQLLKFAVEVSSGMAHLAKQKLVHRDLAARNVLLAGEGNVVKIGDFGLAKDIGNAQEYIRNNPEDFLPIKWMAVESLDKGLFTTASDVWSFGILLYEIVTLGKEPYKGKSALETVLFIGQGNRLEKPSHCSNQLYEIMAKCWKNDAKERPKFSEMWQNLRDMMTDEQKSYIDVQQEIAKSNK